jgi:hypothetical protein
MAMRPFLARFITWVPRISPTSAKARISGDTSIDIKATLIDIIKTVPGIYLYFTFMYLIYLYFTFSH